MTTFRHASSGKDFVLARDPDIGNVSQRSLQQDILVSDAGKRAAFTRKVPTTRLELSFRSLEHQEEADFSQFVFGVLMESEECFELTVPPVVSDEFQAGMTIGGVVPECGQDLADLVDPDCGLTGELECGRFYRVMDELILSNMKIEKGSYRSRDGERKGVDVRIVVFQELEP